MKCHDVSCSGPSAPRAVPCVVPSAVPSGAPAAAGGSRPPEKRVCSYNVHGPDVKRPVQRRRPGRNAGGPVAGAGMRANRDWRDRADGPI